MALSGSAVFANKPPRKVLFVGDSITQAGGYIRHLNKLFNDQGRTGEFELINGGLSSETITGLTEKIHPGPRPYLFDRLDQLLDEHRPDVAYFCYGINCGIYNPPAEETFKRYREGIAQIITKCQSRKIAIRLVAPTPLVLSARQKEDLLQSPQESYSYKSPYPRYNEEVILPFIDILKSFETKKISFIDIYHPLLEVADQAYGKDPIHPNDFGHEVIASVLMRGFR